MDRILFDSQEIYVDLSCFMHPVHNKPFSYSKKEPGSSDIFIQFYTRGSIEWR